MAEGVGATTSGSTCDSTLGSSFLIAVSTLFVSNGLGSSDLTTADEGWTTGASSFASTLGCSSGAVFDASVGTSLEAPNCAASGSTPKFLSVLTDVLGCNSFKGPPEGGMTILGRVWRNKEFSSWIWGCNTTGNNLKKAIATTSPKQRFKMSFPVRGLEGRSDSMDVSAVLGLVTVLAVLGAAAAASGLVARSSAVWAGLALVVGGSGLVGFSLSGVAGPASGGRSGIAVVAASCTSRGGFPAGGSPEGVLSGDHPTLGGGSIAFAVDGGVVRGSSAVRGAAAATEASSGGVTGAGGEGAMAGGVTAGGCSSRFMAAHSRARSSIVF